MINQDRLKRNLPLISWLFVGIVIIPILYLLGIIPIGTVNKLGRYLTFALVATIIPNQPAAAEAPAPSTNDNAISGD